MTTLSIVRGDTAVYDATVSLDGQALNLTGCTLRFTVKENATAPDSAAVISKTSAGGSGITIVSAALGQARIEISSTETATLSPGVNYVWDFQVRKTSGEVYTPLLGKLKVTADITQTTV